MKRTATALLLLFLAAFALSAQEIRDIDETVVLRSDGTARITQVWDVTVVSGTEFYLPFDHLGPMSIDSLSVSENGVEFFSEGDGWDTDRPRERKRGRCGIVRKDNGGVELCWGRPRVDLREREGMGLPLRERDFRRGGRRACGIARPVRDQQRDDGARAFRQRPFQPCGQI